MQKVVGVKFRTSTRVYWFAPTEGEQYEKNTKVVVDTQRGQEFATVVEPIHEVEDEKVVQPLKPIMRKATDADIKSLEADEKAKPDILSTAKEKVAARGLDMKIVDCEYTVDRSKLVLYFTAEQRVDFRDLVRDLASAFHMRIDLRQIGAREECKLIGTLAPCGQPCCCGRFESDCEHVSIKMAKNQGLALTPNKINGMCGRLLCCLAYENKTYDEVMKRAPKHGATVTLPDGRKASVVNVTPLTEKVRVRIGDDENFEFAEYTLSEIKYDKPVQQPQNNNGNNKGNDGNKNNNGNKNGGNKNKNNKPNNKNNDNRNNNVDNNQGEHGEKKGNKKHNKHNKQRNKNNGGQNGVQNKDNGNNAKSSQSLTE
ncbi:MAG: stage 0 sporulation protein [Clostridiales bacterium]|nr:stage 0 sporulation protein [Clostridiales bacterium]